MASQYRRVDDSYAVSGLAALANNSWRIGLMASRDQGEDYRFPGGTAVGKSFERSLCGVHAGYRTEAGDLFVEYRRSETDPSGKPALRARYGLFQHRLRAGRFSRPDCRGCRPDAAARPCRGGSNGTVSLIATVSDLLS